MTIEHRVSVAGSDPGMLYFTRRKRGSAWSGPNKARIERMRASGLMHTAGEEVIERALADGSWTLLDDVEKLIVPPVLADAFEAPAGSREQWDDFPRSSPPAEPRVPARCPDRMAVPE